MLKTHFSKLLVVVVLLGLSLPSKAQPKPDSLSAAPYQRELSGLNTEFKKEGYRLDTLIQDKRFEVYGDIDNRFKSSAERTTPTLDEYKTILGFDKKVKQGAQFIKDHSEQLHEAERQYGISKYVVTAIIGIESKYGEVLGSYNPFNVYVSMAIVGYRTDFAKAQLKELLEFAQRKQIDVFTLKSSYAGAMSPAQFIPYSVNKWWKGKNIFDMDNSIMSVANYLAHFKKRTNNLRTAVLRYNPSGLYADTVLDLADAIKEAEHRLVVH